MSVDLVSQKNIQLTDLFPRPQVMSDKRKGKALTDRLVEYQFIINKALEAGASFKARQYEKFDGIVGESACQVRAVKIAEIASKNLIDVDNLISRLETAKERVDFAMSHEQKKAIEKNEQSLNELITERKLNVPLSDDELYAIQCFILGQASEIVVQKENDVEYMPSLPRKLDNSSPNRILPVDSPIAKRFAADLVAASKTRVSNASVEYVQNLAAVSGDDSLVQALSHPIDHKAHNTHLSCLPAFYSMKVLLQKAQNDNIPILVRVKFLEQEAADRYKVTGEKSLLYKPSDVTGSYELAVPTADDLEKPVCVFEGAAVCAEADWNITSDDYKITDAILGFVADHSQYPGKYPELEKIEDPEFIARKAMANEKGFSAANPSKLFFQHVYPGTAKPAELGLA
ncbi:MAG: hypothetical protein JSS32_10020 [Verrucomicrobia bacterium]|nr:hypothetical protein [Verrucomicrobiota bacterium]